MDSHIGYSIGIIVIFVVLSAYFSATETAFTSLNRIRLKNLAGDGDKRAKRVLELESKYDNLLSTILIGNNIVNIGMTAVATALFLELTPQYGATLSTVVVTVVVLIFGEISPKSLAKESPESFAAICGNTFNCCCLLRRIVFWCYLYKYPVEGESR